MKKLILLLLLSTFFAFAQTRVTPDCVIPFNFTTTASTGNLTCGAPNGVPNGPGIASWIVVYDSTGFSALSLVVQSAPDASGSPGSWATFAGTVLSNTQYLGSSGINPNTATTSAFTGFAGYYPWMRVTLASITGTGRVKGNLFGFLNSTLAKAGGGGGGGTVTIAGTANEITVTGVGCSGATGTCTISIPSNAALPGAPTTTTATTADNSTKIATTAFVNAEITNAFTGCTFITGSLTCPGSITSGSGSGVAGVVEVIQGTAPSPAANAFGFAAPTAITTSEYLQPPNAVPSAHSAIVVGAPASNVSPFVYSVLPDCLDSGGNHLNYTQSSDAYSCGTSSSGGGGSAGATLFSTTNSTTVTATSPTTLLGTVTGSKTVPANTFTAGQVLEFVAQGYYTTPATPVSLTITLNIGGTIRITTGAVVQIASVTTGVWRLRCAVTTRTAGASGTQIANCIFEETGATLTPGEAPMQTSSTWTIDTTATQVIDLVATWSTAVGSPTITSTNVAAWIPGAPVTSVGGLTGAVPGQGTDANVLTSGTVSGLAAPLCTDANAGATTVGCPSGGPTSNQNIRSFGAGFNGGGAAITSGSTVYVTVPFACTIVGFNITADTGTISFDVWKLATGTAIPTISATILSGGFLALSAGTALHSASTALFTTTAVAANDIFAFNVEAVSGATNVSLVIQCNAT